MTHFNSYNELISFFKYNPPSNCYVEKHHIIPKHLGGTNEKSNIISLPFQYHIYAHYLLAIESTSEKYKAYNFLACQMILNNPKGCTKHNLLSFIEDDDFVFLIEQTRKNVNKTKRVIIHNETREKHILQSELEYYLSLGWIKGRLPSVMNYILSNRKPSSRTDYSVSEETKKIISEKTKEGMKKAKKQGKQIGHKKGTSTSSKGKIVITNGLKNKYIFPSDPIPQGWWRGSTQNHKKH